MKLGKMVAFLLFAAACAVHAGPAAVTVPPLPDKPELDLPPVVYAAPGIETNIYFANVFDAVVPENFVYLVKCAKGRLEDRRWCWTPTEKDAGTRVPLTLEVRDDRGTVARAECEVRVAGKVKDPKRRITLALLSASSATSGYPQFLMETMHANGFVNYTPVGSYHRCGLPLKPGLAASESYGGWAWRSFLHQWAYSTREIQSIQDAAEKAQMEQLGVRTVNPNNEYKLKSPLLKMVDGKVVRDVQGWFDRVNGGKAPDFILIDLGRSEAFIRRENEIQAYLQNEVLPAMTELVDELRKAAPNATIGICRQMLGSRRQSAYGANYGCLQTRYQDQRNGRLYNKLAALFVAARNDPEIVIVPYYTNIDPVWGYPMRPVPVSAREKTQVTDCVNALHTSASGGHQLADAVYCWLVEQLVRKGW